MILTFFLGLASAVASPAAAETPTRERLSLNDGWRFQKEDPAGTGDALGYSKIKDWLLPTSNAFRSKSIEVPTGTPPGENVSYAQPGFDDSGWRLLNLPHDWGVEGPFKFEHPGETGKLPWWGVAWYRKSFDLPAIDRGRQVFLEIDGAMAYSAVWCNGRFVGGWPFGYASYRLDLTSYVKPGASNTLAIRLDNPNHSSRWYPGGGIYRNVWLVKTAPVRVAHWGTTVTTPEVSPSSATVKLDVRIDAAASAKVQIHTQIFRLETHQNGEIKRVPDAASSVETVRVSPDNATTVKQTIQVKSPALWSTDAPHLYVAVTRIAEQRKVIDTYETTFGIRKAEFTVDDGFHLNGKRLPLQGVCMHHDLGALGAAFNTRAAERQLEILKEMGVNAVRTSHNPPAPEFLDLCDRMGILVLDELVDTWSHRKKPNDYHRLFSDWAEADLRAMIRRDRNRACVIMWSLGNELGEQRKEEGMKLAAKMAGISHEEDPTRPTTIGVNAAEGGFNGFQKTVDVFGYNYKPHLYGKFRATNPDQPLYGSETASTISSRGEYGFPVSEDREQGRIGYFQMSSYDWYTPPWATTPDTEFKAQDENPFVAGEFIWTGFDYLGEPTPYNSDMTNLLNYQNEEERARVEKELQELGKVRVPSRSSYFGAIDLAGFKKDRFYIYQARWRPDFPMAHILPHWNWEGREGETTPVHVYTSGDEAELFLNGQSLGRKKKGKFEYRFRWDDVKYTPGELKVVAYKDGRKWAENMVKTTGPAAKLALNPDRGIIRADGRDLSFVTVAVCDATERMVPNAKQSLRFEVSGPGEIVATDNGDATDLTVFASAERKAFNGLALVIVRAKPGVAGEIVLKASSDGMSPATVTIRAVK